ncbi:aromatic aminotransferase [Ilyonectria robusta]
MPLCRQWNNSRPERRNLGQKQYRAPIHLHLLTPAFHDALTRPSPQQRAGPYLPAPVPIPHAQRVVESRSLGSSSSCWPRGPCTVLQDIARGCHPVFIPCTRGEDRSVIRLLGTLSKNPVLAAHIREITSIVGYWSSDRVRHRDFALFNELREKFHVDRLGRRLKIRADWIQQRWKTSLNCNLELIQLGFVIALAPNLERLEVCLDTARIPFIKKDHLPHLAHFTLKPTPDTSEMSLDVAQNILEAAPNLRSITASRICSAPNVPILQNLKTLKLLFSAMAAEDFERLMRAFPQLRSFTFQSGGAAIVINDEAEPADIEQAIRIRRDTLRHLDISIGVGMGMRLDDDEDRETMSAFNWSQLTHLSVDSQAIYWEREDEMPTDGNRLVDLLPKTIRVFKLTSRQRGNEEDILNLADAAPEMFPNLRLVEFCDLDRNEREPIKEAFKKVGITCRCTVGWEASTMMQLCFPSKLKRRPVLSDRFVIIEPLTNPNQAPARGQRLIHAMAPSLIAVAPCWRRCE